MRERVLRFAGRTIRRAETLSTSARLFLFALWRPHARREQRTEIILHAGDHKTGTKTIQASILSARKRLAAQGVHVVRTGQGRADGGHHALVTALHDQTLGTLDARLLETEIARAFPGRALISSEKIKRIVVEGGGHRLLDALRAAGAGHIQILFYLRSPAGKANAHYSQTTAALQMSGLTFSEFLRSSESSQGYAFECLSDLARRDDVDLVVRPYSAAVRSSALSDFADAIGVDLSGTVEPRHNRSYGPVGIEAMRRLAAEIGPIEPGVRQRLRLRVNAVARALEEESYWGVDPQHRALLEDAERRTDAFAHTVWGRGWREVVGDEDRNLNVFDPANDVQRAALEQTLEEMRRIAKQVLG
jgi:hypothetical protein